MRPARSVAILAALLALSVAMGMARGGAADGEASRVVGSDSGADSAPTDSAPTGSDAGAAQAPAARYSATDLYNLGNAYARAGKPAMAVLNYERAALLAPGDPDIEANLRFVREAAKVPVAAPSWFERTLTAPPPTLLYWTGLLGILMVGAGLLANRVTPGYRGLRRLGIAVGVLLAALTAGNAWILWPRLHEAVVLNAATPARVSPVPMGDPVFTLPEAETVSITARHEGFLLVRTRAGKIGWVAGASLAPVVPAP